MSQIYQIVRENFMLRITFQVMDDIHVFTIELSDLYTGEVIDAVEVNATESQVHEIVASPEHYTDLSAIVFIKDDIFDKAHSLHHKIAHSSSQEESNGYATLQYIFAVAHKLCRFRINT